MPVKIQQSSVDTDTYFNLNGLDYQKGLWEIQYESVLLDNQGNPLESAIEIGLRNKMNSSEFIQSPVKISSWVNSSGTPYTALGDLLGDLSELVGFNTAGESAALKTGKYLLGWQDFADTATTVTPIVQSNVNGGEVQLTNNNQDTLTDGTTTNNAETTIKGVNDLWNNQTNTLVFNNTGIKLNDVVDLRAELKVNASILDCSFDMRIDFYDQPDGLGNKVFDLTDEVHVETISAGVFRKKQGRIRFFIGQSILNGSGVIYLTGTKSFQVEVIGWNLDLKTIAR